MIRVVLEMMSYIRVVLHMRSYIRFNFDMNSFMYIRVKLVRRSYIHVVLDTSLYIQVVLDRRYHIRVVLERRIIQVVFDMRSYIRVVLDVRWIVGVTIRFILSQQSQLFNKERLQNRWLWYLLKADKISENHGRKGVRTPCEITKKIGFLCNAGPNPLKKHKATKPTFNVWPSSVRQRNAISMAFRWRAVDGPFIAVFRSSIPHQPFFFFIKFGPPLTKLSGSAHENVHRTMIQTSSNQPTYIVGPLSANQLNAIRMAFRWLADSDPL